MIELVANGNKAIIDEEGAWLKKLTLNGRDILYPKSSLSAKDGSVKIRGGMHVCLPNFGPGGRSGQPQHGYGRMVEWGVSEMSADAVVLRHVWKQGLQTIESRLTYTLVPSGIVTNLVLLNSSDDNIRVAPGFHPYFIFHSGDDIVFNGARLDTLKMEEVSFVSGQSHELELGPKKLFLTSEQMLSWALWTDNLDNYVCIEPTVAGFSFENDLILPEEDLSPGQSRQYDFTISV